MEGLRLTLDNEICEVRGAGLMIGIELTQPVAAIVKQIMFDKGYLIGSVGQTVIRLLPPLILSEDLVDPFILDLSIAIKEAQAS